MWSTYSNIFSCFPFTSHFYLNIQLEHSRLKVGPTKSITFLSPPRKKLFKFSQSSELFAQPLLERGCNYINRVARGGWAERECKCLLSMINTFGDLRSGLVAGYFLEGTYTYIYIFMTISKYVFSIYSFISWLPFGATRFFLNILILDWKCSLAFFLWSSMPR